MTVTDRFRAGWEHLGRGLDAVRTRPPRRWALQVAFAVLGLALVILHWAGFLVGGALVGILSDSWRRAILAGLTFGVVAWAAFALRLAITGGLATYLASGQLLLVSLVVAVGLGTLGGFARALVP